MESKFANKLNELNLANELNFSSGLQFTDGWLRPHQRNLKEILVTLGSDNEDDFTMNKGFIQYVL